MFNSQIIGNLGADAVIKEISSKRVITFSVAHSDIEKTDTGTAEQTTWISVVYSSEILLPYLKKGTKVYVSGRTKAKVYRDKNNEPQVSITLYASEVVLCGSKTDDRN